MNFYVIVEGRRTEPPLYRAWLPLLRPGIVEIQRLEDATADTEAFYLVAGGGYPRYNQVIRAALSDVTRDDLPTPFFLIIAVDAEELPTQERMDVIEAVIQTEIATQHLLSIPRHIVVADCCIESWLLGHARIVPRHPQDETLRRFQTFYNVALADPERMPLLPDAGFETRAQFHEAYLKAICAERGTRYTKNHPGPTRDRAWFEGMRARTLVRDPITQDPHLRSFQRLLDISALRLPGAP